jgi:hypothetical protein
MLGDGPSASIDESDADELAKLHVVAAAATPRKLNEASGVSKPMAPPKPSRFLAAVPRRFRQQEEGREALPQLVALKQRAGSPETRSLS